MGVETAFAQVVRTAGLTRINLDCCTPPLVGVRGILTTTKIMYQQSNLIGREHEYFFWLRDHGPLEVSVQFYANTAGHWRLFAYTTRGMLFSVNLTTATEDASGVVVEQTLTIRSRSLEAGQREQNRDALVRCLQGMGYEIRGGHRVYLGTFDGGTGTFLDTTAVAFVRDFVVLAITKGHFMANKGYVLPGLRVERAAPKPALLGQDGQNRVVPAALRFRVLERDRRCLACGITPESGARLHVDHIEPYSLGGRTVESNLQTLCADCNVGKGNRSSADFRNAHPQEIRAGTAEDNGLSESVGYRMSQTTR